jgi:hypothetical protein
VCGPSGQQKSLAGTEQNFAGVLQSDYASRFGQQSAVLQNLNSTLTPIFEQGPNQQGFGAQELAALNTAAGEGVGSNYAKASRALNNQLAVRGGGNEVLPSGAADQLKEELASAGAAQSSALENQITTANYAQGRKNWQEAGAGLSALAGEFNPSAYGSLTSGANQAAFSEATKIQDMKNQEQADIAGGVASLAMDAASFGAGALGGGGFDFAGGLQALTGKG